MRKLESAGYHVPILKLDSRTVGIPQARIRVYIIGYRRDTTIQLSAESFDQQCQAISAALTDGHAMVPLDRFLYSETCVKAVHMKMKTIN